MEESIDVGNSLPPPALSVARMPQLVELRDPSDDWTGVTSTAERKRRQNRLNQRAYRRRKHGPHEESSMQSKGDELCRREDIREAGSIHSSSSPEDEGMSPRQGYVLIPCPERRAKIRAFMQRAYEEYTIRAPRPKHLQVLIRLNALNAITLNAIALGFEVRGLCHDDTISPFSAQGPGLPNRLDSSLLSSCPKSLHPTSIQVSVPHHPWLDLFPFPSFRDNALQGIVNGLLDEDELCRDLLEVEEENDGETASLLVWGQSWDVEGWEASVAFLKKWGWLARGSPELIESTNIWRKKRGEKPLVFPVE